MRETIDVTAEGVEVLGREELECLPEFGWCRGICGAIVRQELIC